MSYFYLKQDGLFWTGRCWSEEYPDAKVYKSFRLASDDAYLYDANIIEVEND